tara:strand:- start:2671 stop:3540 length:870 start_codon:yes stop_codon:yes gene_type:complete
MGKREAMLGISVGRKGVGKTYTTLEMIQEVLNGNPETGSKPRKVLILDVNNEFGNVKSDQNDRFHHIKAMHLQDVRKFTLSNKIEARRVSVMKPEGGKMNLVELSDALGHILESYENGLLLVEDLTKFVSDSLPSDLIGSICTQRHVSVDVIIHFQSIGKAAHPKLWGNCNWLRFHKCDDTVERHKNKFAGNIDHLNILEKMVDIEYEKGNKRFYAFLNKDDHLIQGNFTKRQFQWAVYQYLQDNYSKVVNPMLKKKDLMTGELIYKDHKDLVKKLIKLYTDKYYGNVN